MMRFLFLFSLFMQLQNPSPCASQSLDNGLIWMLRDTVKINALIDSGWKATYSSLNDVVRLSEKALLMANNLMWERGKTKSLLLLAKSYDYIGNYKEALQLNYQALVISKRTIDKINEANALRQIGGMYEVLGDYSKAILYHQRSYSLCKKIGYLKGIGSSLNDQGIVYYNKLELEKAIWYFSESITVKNKIGDYKNLINSYTHLADVYLSINDYERAMEFQFKGLEIAERINDFYGISRILISIGMTKLLSKDFTSALVVFNKALQINKRINDKPNQAATLDNIGVVYEKLKLFDKAMDYFQLSLQIHKRTGDLHSQAAANSNIGSVLISMSKYDLAEKHIMSSLKTDRELKNIFNEIDDFIILSKINMMKGNINQALHYSQIVSSKLKKHRSLIHEQNLSELQSQLFEKQGKFKTSLIAYKRFITLRDSAINQNKKVAVALKEAKYEFDKKALADSLKNNEAQKAKDLQIKFKDSELQKQKLKQNAMLAGIVVLFVLGWLLFSRYKAVSLQQVSERKLMLLEKEQALVEERTRIADEMHDDVGADLSNLLLKIRMNEHTQTQSATPSVDLGGLKNSTNGIIHKIDEIIWSLNSHRDSLPELVNFIVKYFDTILKENNLYGKADVQETIPSIALAAKQRRNIYLTVKEILNNALKHSQARSIQLKVGFENNILEIKVCDNGKGFDTEKSFQGNGLRNMRKRLEMMDGKLEIKSVPNSGSTFLMFIPVV